MTQDNKTITDDELQDNERAAEVYATAVEISNGTTIGPETYDYFQEAKNALDSDTWTRLANRIEGQLAIDIEWVSEAQFKDARSGLNTFDK